MLGFGRVGNSLPLMSSSRLLSVVGGVRIYYVRFWESGKLVASDVIKVTVRCKKSSQLLCLVLGDWETRCQRCRARQ